MTKTKLKLNPIATGIAIVAFLGCAMSASAQEAPKIKHTFMAVDATPRLHYVCQSDPSKDWSIKIDVKSPGHLRMLQLIGDGKIMCVISKGFVEISLTEKKVTRTFAGCKDIMSAYRMADGQTWLLGWITDPATKKVTGSVVYKIDAADKIAATINLPAPIVKSYIMQVTAEGHMLLGSGGSGYELDKDGKVLHEFKPGAFRIGKLSSGNYLLTEDYNCTVLEVKPDGTVVKKYGGKDHPQAKELAFYQFTGAQFLKNGNLVVTHWNGHSPEDSKNGPHLFEFSPEGKIVWSYFDPQRCTTVLAAVILDDLDISKYHDQSGGSPVPIGKAAGK